MKGGFTCLSPGGICDGVGAVLIGPGFKRGCHYRMGSMDGLLQGINLSAIKKEVQREMDRKQSLMADIQRDRKKQIWRERVLRSLRGFF